MTSHLSQICDTISQYIVKHMQLNVCYSYQWRSVVLLLGGVSFKFYLNP